MKSTLQILINSLNFSDKKAKTYLALLELGESEASDIAKKAGLKRTTVYNILPELVSDGLATMSLSNNNRLYFIETPKKLSDLLDEKKSEVASILPSLESLRSLFFNKPKITMYDGVNGLKEIYSDFIQSTSKGETILAYAGTRDAFKYAPEEFVRSFAQKRVNRNIQLKLISGSSMLSDELIKTDNQNLRTTKVSDSKDFDYAGETIIYGNKVAFISYRENFFGVVIDSKEISSMLRASFNLAWDSLV
jgi:sugar-specific transcriptional regulator TrmB